MKPNAKVNRAKYIHWLCNSKEELIALAEDIINTIVKTGEFRITAKDLTEDIGYLPINLVINTEEFKDREEEYELNPAEWNEIIFEEDKI
jgi:hypothetical protein